MIRDTEGKWHELSQYIADRANTEFTHGICPPCFRQHIDPMLVEAGYPDFSWGSDRALPVDLEGLRSPLRWID